MKVVLKSRYILYSLISLYLVVGNSIIHAIDERCFEIETCLKGGQSNDLCVISSRRCPPCVLYPNECYEYESGQPGKCPFGNTFDCRPVFILGMNSTTPTPVSNISSESNSLSMDQSDSASGEDLSSSSSVKDDKVEGSGSVIGVVPRDSAALIVVIFGIALAIFGITMLFCTLIKRSKHIPQVDGNEHSSPNILSHDQKGSNFGGLNSQTASYYPRRSLASNSSLHHGNSGYYPARQSLPSTHLVGQYDHHYKEPISDISTGPPVFQEERRSSYYIQPPLRASLASMHDAGMRYSQSAGHLTSLDTINQAPQYYYSNPPQRSSLYAAQDNGVRNSRSAMELTALDTHQTVSVKPTVVSSPHSSGDSLDEPVSDSPQRYNYEQQDHNTVYSTDPHNKQSVDILECEL